MSKERTRLRSLLDAAVKSERALENERDEKISQTRGKIIEEYRTLLNEKRHAVKDARTALFKYIDENVSHPHEGQIVVRERTLYHRWSSKVRGVEKTYGIVETVRTNCDMPSNLAQYSRPKVGDVIIRALKKDNSPSIKFHDKFNAGSQNYKDLPNWELAPNGVDTPDKVS